MVTVRQLLAETAKALESAGCDSPAFDARCLLEDIGGVGRGRIDQSGEHPVPCERERAVRVAAKKRAAGYPLQYLLGEWDFLSLTLHVGEGVLIPRPETELLCETAAHWMNGRRLEAPRVLDLCAGSGCVGLGIASLAPSARVTAVEWSEEAFPYLLDNLARYPQYDIEAVKADVLRDAGRFSQPVDLIVSNPPYIPSGDIAGLMREVGYEPRMALDGGDGLRFYRSLARDWRPKLLPGGVLMAEIGMGQSETVAALWREARLDHIKILPDAAGIERVVVGENLR